MSISFEAYSGFERSGFCLHVGYHSAANLGQRATAFGRRAVSTVMSIPGNVSDVVVRAMSRVSSATSRNLDAVKARFTCPIVTMTAADIDQVQRMVLGQPD